MNNNNLLKRIIVYKIYLSDFHNVKIFVSTDVEYFKEFKKLFSIF